MFDFFKKTPRNIKSEISNLKLNLSGLHCTSCAVDIDLTLEDLPGVTNSKTNYVKSASVVDFEPDKISPKEIIEQIKKLGYEVKDSS